MAKNPAGQRLTYGQQTLLVDLVVAGYRAGQWVRALDRVTDWTPDRITEVAQLAEYGLLESEAPVSGGLFTAIRSAAAPYRLTPLGARVGDELVVEFYRNTLPDLAAAAAKRLADELPPH